MKNLMIRPLLTLLTQTATRAQVKDGDLCQVENRVQNIRKQKLAQAAPQPSTRIEDKYLQIIQELREHFSGTPVITHTALVKKCTEIIRREKLFYVAAESETLQSSLFYPSSARGKLIKTHEYDIAFYNELARPGYSEGHSSDENLPAVFYIRVEETVDSLIIGNMQIDAGRGSSWANSEKQKIMLANKNLYLHLVQNAVATLLPKNKKMLFQSGDAVAVAQWGSCPYKHLEITPGNYSRYQKLYEKALAQFDQLRIGDFSLEQARDGNIVIEKTPDYYRQFDFNLVNGNSGTLLTQLHYQVTYNSNHNPEKIN